MFAPLQSLRPFSRPLFVAASGVPSMTNVLARWKGDDYTVGSWTDASGNGRTATQATGSRQPALATNVLNGHSVARCVDDMLDVTLTLTQPFTYVVVCKAAVSSTGNPMPIIGRQDGNGAQLATSPSGQMYIYSGAQLFGSAIGTSWNVFRAVFNGGSSALYRNGALEASGNAGSTGATDLSLAGMHPNASFVFNGDIADAVVIQGSADGPAWETYLRTLYAI